MGTSLTVHPFASLAGLVSDDCPRVLINMERVGDFGERADDVILLGKCDIIVKELCKELGWGDELSEAWEKTADLVESFPQPAGGKEGEEEEKKGEEAGAKGKGVDKTAASPDIDGDLEEKRVQDEVEALTAAVEESLKLTEDCAPGNSESKTNEPASSSLGSKKDPGRRSSVLGRLVSKLNPNGTHDEKNQAKKEKL
jgi:NAD-dependent histone deacetylase SIR2